IEPEVPAQVLDHLRHLGAHHVPAAGELLGPHGLIESLPAPGPTALTLRPGHGCRAMRTIPLRWTGAAGWGSGTGGCGSPAAPPHGPDGAAARCGQIPPPRAPAGPRCAAGCAAVRRRPGPAPCRGLRACPPTAPRAERWARRPRG